MWPIKQRKREKRKEEEKREKSDSKFFARQMASECEKLLTKWKFHSQMASKTVLFPGLLGGGGGAIDGSLEAFGCVISCF